MPHCGFDISSSSSCAVGSLSERPGSATFRCAAASVFSPAPTPVFSSPPAPGAPVSALAGRRTSLRDVALKCDAQGAKTKDSRGGRGANPRPPIQFEPGITESCGEKPDFSGPAPTISVASRAPFPNLSAGWGAPAPQRPRSLSLSSGSSVAAAASVVRRGGGSSSSAAGGAVRVRRVSSMPSIEASGQSAALPLQPRSFTADCLLVSMSSPASSQRGSFNAANHRRVSFSEEDHQLFEAFTPYGLKYGRHPWELDWDYGGDGLVPVHDEEEVEMRKKEHEEDGALVEATDEPPAGDRGGAAVELKREGAEEAVAAAAPVPQGHVSVSRSASGKAKIGPRRKPLNATPGMPMKPWKDDPGDGNDLARAKPCSNLPGVVI